MVTHLENNGIRGMAPGGTKERELGWLGWSMPRDISRDGRKILFDEEGEGGGPNYTVFLRDTDGSPPIRIGEGLAMALSPDTKWAITKPAKGGPLNLVPTGAGETRQLTHDSVSYRSVRWFPDGKRLLASGIEVGQGVRDYLIDVSSGDAKPITPEGVSGVMLSPDSKSVAVLGADGKWGIWPLEGGGIRVIPGLAIDPATQRVVTGDVAAQTERVLRNLSAILEAVGSGLGKVVRSTVFLKNMNDFAAMNQVYGKYFSCAPARSTVEVARLPKYVLVEIDVIALA